MSAITTHILDTARGRPASGVPVTLEVRSIEGDWKLLGRGSTDADGRSKSLLPEGFTLATGTYRLTFDTASYFRAYNLEGFYPVVKIVFEVKDRSQDYHVPLLLAPHGYSTYRGS
ncbi:MAG: hydroxyisourate hydrolase [Thermoanaerobaculia bacterium]